VSILEALVLAVVQGLTEFLPVSSSGHLVVGSALLRDDLSSASREAYFVWLHAASFLAVLLFFARDLIELLRRADRIRVVLLLAVGCLPAGLAGIAYHLSGMSGLFDHVWVVGIAWLVTAALLWSTRGSPAGDLDLLASGRPFPWRIILLIGLAQAAAILPGISRSGATIAVALLLGVRGHGAFRYSFLMALPLILGATVLEARGIGDLAGDLGWAVLATGFAACFLVSWLALGWLRRAVEAGGLHRFSPYLAAVAVAALLWQALQAA
jgi:undecaprenyl-diphosphatase